VQRADEWEAIRTRALIDAMTTETGATLRYRNSAEVEATLHDLVEAERECCAVGGIEWDLTVADDVATVSIGVPQELRESSEAAVIYAVLSGRS